MSLMIPDAATKRHMAILGTNGSGKTSVAKSQVVEPALAAGERVCCIDPTGVMWGVRLGAKGSPLGGFPVYIVGGEHADFPLTKRDGKAWAEIVGTSSDSFVFDTSLMTVADRTAWFTDFAETLIRKNKGPLRLIEDEAHLFAPQGGAKAGGLAPDMLHAANNLLALGRSKGLRITMISQRPAKLHKDSLSQAHTLVAMKLVAPQDRNAIKDWVADQTDPESGKELIASLPKLKPGEGWVWAPADGILKRVQFPLPKTYDSSRAPDEQEGEGPALSPIDPAAVQARLAEVAAEAVANDPAKLKAEVARLTREMQARPAITSAPSVVDPKIIEAAEKRAFEEGRNSGYEEGQRHGFVRGWEKARHALAELVNACLPPETIPLAPDGPLRVTRTQPIKRVVNSAPKTKVSEGNSVLGAERKPLIPLASASPGGLTEAQWATIAGFKRTGGTWSTYKSRLRGGGYIEQRGNLWYATADGLDAVGEVPPAPSTPEERIAMWKASLGSGPSNLLDELVSVYPDAMARDDLALNAGMTASGGTFTTYLSRLSGNGLIEKQGHQIRAAEALFA